MMHETSDELSRRARVHAALGDPARLAIIDMLTLGEASPSELQALLEMPSNLLAHHVRTLSEWAWSSEAGRRATGDAPTYR